MTPWSRLQALSCEHANRLGKQPTFPLIRSLGMRYQSGHNPPMVIVENIEILTRGDDEEMKSRVHWYITFYPEVFQACSKVWNATQEVANA